MTISAKKATTNLSQSELIRQFDQLKSQCATIVITLGTPPDAKHQIPRVQKLAAKLGLHMQRVARANLKQSSSKTLCDSQRLGYSHRRRLPSGTAQVSQ